MRRQSIRNKSHRKKLGGGDLDITSLLDICTILLCFLIQTFDTNTVQITVPNEITLPTSQTKQINDLGVNIHISATKIWVDNQLILDTSNMPSKFLDQGDRLIIPLFDELMKKKESVQRLNKTVDQAGVFSGLLNLVVDKSIKYSYLKKIMYTAAQAGYKEYKFVVRGVDG